MVSHKEGLTFLSKAERLAFIKERHKWLILDGRGEASIGPIVDLDDDDDDDMDEPMVDVPVSDYDYDEN